MSSPAPLVDLATRIRTNQLLAGEAAERVRILSGDRERDLADATTADFADSDNAGYIDRTGLEA